MNGVLIGGERDAVVRHARRVTGQVSALGSMISTDRPFTEVAQQLLAARGSLDSLLVRLVVLELRDCVPSREVRDEVDELLRTALGRAAPGRRALHKTTAQLPDPLRPDHPHGGTAR